MAKKQTSKKAPAPKHAEDDNMLPQNIISLGERVEENKNIYIFQPTYKAIHRFAKGKTKNESGGMLVGDIIEEFGKTNIIICGFIEAKYCEATPTTLTFTHETWDYCHKEMAKKYPGKKIIGWIHTHPNFGIFLSEYDKFIHENFFKEEYDIAYVVDPIQNTEGFYFWINGRIERCKGFYIYDKTGAKISIESPSEKEVTAKTDSTQFLFQSILIVVLSLAVAILMFTVVRMSEKISDLQSQQDQQGSFILGIYQNQVNLQQQIQDLQGKIDALTLSDDAMADSNSGNDAAKDGSDNSSQPENNENASPTPSEGPKS